MVKHQDQDSLEKEGFIWLVVARVQGVRNDGRDS